MRAVMLFAVVATATLSFAPAYGSVFTVGSLAASCYQSSLSYNVERGALDTCSRALDEEALSDEDQVATYVNRGIVRMNLGDHPGADRDFETALAMDQNEAEAWLNQGLLRLREGKPQAAVPLIERAMATETIRPALALYARGVAHEQLGQLKAAYADLVKARELAPAWRLPAEQLKRYQVR